MWEHNIYMFLIKHVPHNTVMHFTKPLDFCFLNSTTDNKHRQHILVT